MAGGLLMALSTWRGHEADALADEEDDVDEGSILGRVAIASVPLLVPPCLEFIQDLRGGGSSPEFLIGMVLVLGLAFVRTARLLKSESRARTAVRRSEHYYAQLAENSSDAVIVVGADGRALNRSPQLARLVGFEAPTDENAWDRLLAWVGLESLMPLFTTLSTTPNKVIHTEMQVKHQDGRNVWLSARLVDLLHDPDVNGVVVALSDITDRKNVESELANARDAAVEGSRAKSDFLATMSHEIRTPMNGVIGLTGLLLTTELDERQRQYAHGVRGAGEALLTIINDILDFSKVEAGKLQLEAIDFDLVQIVEEAAGLVAGSAQDKQLELLAYCSPDLPLGVRGDPSRIRQVLLNLTSNAVKFTDHGEVVVGAHLEDQSAEGVVVRFEVTDTGIGIAEGNRDRLFEPFSQADSSTTRRFGGTGLGLAISHQLVVAMGGTIEVASQENQGSTFSFTVPLGHAVDRANIATRSTDQLAGTKVLVVDDNQTNRLVLSEQLGAWEMLPDVVADAMTALQQLDEAARSGRPYALAVLDLCMPGMDGLALARRISSSPSLARTGLVLLTSGPDVSAEEAREAGIGVRLTKPVRLSQLHAALQNLTSTSLSRDTTMSRPAAPRFTGIRGHVLVVEDNPINQMVAVGILEHLGYSSEVAGNGLEALTAVGRTPFSAVLMDCQMPEMDGYEATAVIRQQEGEGRRTPIIAMTAGALAGDKERCLGAGMDDYVPKPVSPEAVGLALARWLPAPLV